MCKFYAYCIPFTNSCKMKDQLFNDKFIIKCEEVKFIYWRYHSTNLIDLKFYIH